MEIEGVASGVKALVAATVGCGTVVAVDVGVGVVEGVRVGRGVRVSVGLAIAAGGGVGVSVGREVAVAGGAGRACARAVGLVSTVGRVVAATGVSATLVGEAVGVGRGVGVPLGTSVALRVGVRVSVGSRVAVAVAAGGIGIGGRTDGRGPAVAKVEGGSCAAGSVGTGGGGVGVGVREGWRACVCVAVSRTISPWLDVGVTILATMVFGPHETAIAARAASPNRPSPLTLFFDMVAANDTSRGNVPPLCNLARFGFLIWANESRLSPVRHSTSAL